MAVTVPPIAAAQYQRPFSIACLPASMTTAIAPGPAISGRASGQNEMSLLIAASLSAAQPWVLRSSFARISCHPTAPTISPPPRSTACRVMPRKDRIHGPPIRNTSSSIRAYRLLRKAIDRLCSADAFGVKLRKMPTFPRGSVMTKSATKIAMNSVVNMQERYRYADMFTKSKDE